MHADDISTHIHLAVHAAIGAAKSLSAISTLFKMLS